MSAARKALEGLIAATPEPPAGAEPGDIVEAGREMVRARSQWMSELYALGKEAVETDPNASELVALIRDRDRAWTRAFELAHQELNLRRTNVRRLRQRRR